MDYANLIEILNFAIEREKDAIYFYQQLIHLPQFKVMEDELIAIQKMEESHVKMLLKVKEGEITNLNVKSVRTLSLAEYLVAGNAFEDMTYQDLLIIAMKRELASQSLYLKLSEESENVELKKLFLNLSNEEAAHKLHFEKIYDKEVLKEN